MKFNIRPFTKMILLTFFAEMSVALAFFLIYRLIGDHFGTGGVGEYSLIKKLAGFLVPVLFAGIGIGLPRYIAVAQSRAERGSYLKAALIFVAATVFLSFLILNAFPAKFSKLFFGSENYAAFIFPLSIFLIGNAAHILTYCYLRGRLKVKLFNLLQIVNLAIIPIVLLINFNFSLEKFVFCYGIVIFSTSVFLILFFVGDFFCSYRDVEFRKKFSELIIYSAPRVGADFALFGILLLGPIYAAHFSSLEDAGFFAIGQSLVVSAGSIISPLGIILLPKISQLASRQGAESLAGDVRNFIKAILFFSFFLFFQISIFLDLIIKFWLGDNFSGAILPAQLLFFAAVPYMFYISARDLLDAFEKKSINTINLMITLFLYILISSVLIIGNNFLPIISLSAAFSLAILLLGLLSYQSLNKIFKRRNISDILFIAKYLTINLILAAFALFSRPFLGNSLVSLLFFELAIGGIYCATLIIFKEKWALAVISRLMIFQEK